MTSPFHGRSLAFVRTVMNRRGPLFPSALQMAQHYKDELVGDPAKFQVGMVVFWRDIEPGDCGIYVGERCILCLDTQGYAMVRPMRMLQSPILGAMFWPSPVPPVREARNG